MKNTALITGACVNTGTAIVRKFAGEGWNVIFTGRDKDRVENAEKEYAKDFGDSVEGFALGSLDPAGRADEASVKSFSPSWIQRGSAAARWSSTPPIRGSG